MCPAARSTGSTRPYDGSGRCPPAARPRHWPGNRTGRSSVFTIVVKSRAFRGATQDPSLSSRCRKNRAACSTMSSPTRRGAYCAAHSRSGTARAACTSYTATAATRSCSTTCSSPMASASPPTAGRCTSRIRPARRSGASGMTLGPPGSPSARPSGGRAGRSCRTGWRSITAVASSARSGAAVAWYVSGRMAASTDAGECPPGGRHPWPSVARRSTRFS